ncbi:hypothetical protein QQW99_19735 [Bacillus amyloliquefaciens]|uniref:hypothetical protein n=1 Tax=Bacillus amyloliquefaciens TaxID=1390 RepID=UPI00255BD542|nr:hypothetical protein [Bacillus amyloliquefaciens]WIX29286.1 hypothetical protein QQW99_19735 [Bacillus amyloliquefaciens]
MTDASPDTPFPQQTTDASPDTPFPQQTTDASPRSPSAQQPPRLRSEEPLRPAAAPSEK